MNKGLIKLIVSFSLFVIILAGCQAKEEEPSEKPTPVSKSVEPTKSDKEADHEHAHNDENLKEIYSGKFEDDQIEDRALSDWKGDWQSIYPYLLDGTLDEVLQKKVETKKDKTFEEYKAYYTAGYETDIDRIVIEDDAITFYKNGEGKTGEYKYHGYEILTYESGSRGVRFLFDLVGEADGLPKHVQFSDHSIYPTKAEHYHIYFSDEPHEILLNELDNWPTYYLSNLSGKEIVEEMNAH